MNNKYYTPQIEEFRIGFECEFFNNMQDKIWKKEVCDIDLINLAYDCYEHGTVEWNDDITQTFRVKYLDSEDIESLGFVKNNYLGVNCFEKSCWRLYWFGKDNMITIEKFYEVEREQYFRGWIKNKSELKVLLNQLGIK